MKQINNTIPSSDWWGLWNMIVPGPLCDALGVQLFWLGLGSSLFDPFFPRWGFSQCFWGRFYHHPYMVCRCNQVFLTPNLMIPRMNIALRGLTQEGESTSLGARSPWRLAFSSLFTITSCLLFSSDHILFIHHLGCWSL
jgi:hypothetical protein